ncbi:hypothetical protein BDV97DRAFT_125865 [Delphinella strobiligena]|nr:hypothetical protein BDV97DRAFT_125865 [Delphinella strobiligena]
MEVQATYTLASCTMATARNFTNDFSTGWGMADMRGAAEEYNMSNLGSSSAGRSTQRATIETEKSKDRRRSSTPDLALKSEAKAFDQIHEEKRRRKASAAGMVDGEEDEMHILKNTEYTVSHEVASNSSRFRDSV